MPNPSVQLSPQVLKELFVGGKFLRAKEFDMAADQASSRNWSIPQAILELGLLSDAQIGALLAEQLGYFFVDLVKQRPEPNTLLLFPKKVAKAQEAIPMKRVGGELWVATSKVDNYEFFKLVEKVFHMPVHVVYATSDGVESALKFYEEDVLLQVQLLLKAMEKGLHEEDVSKLVTLMVQSAYERHASDIHIEPEKENVVVRYRIDGRLHEAFRYPRDFHDQVVFRIKILSKLRTDEHAQAQDGRFGLIFPGGGLSLRVSILPITYGENIVMRLLFEGSQRLLLEDLGLQSDDLEKVKRASEQPHGMILLSGPTGSGKTTTLYAVMTILNQPDVNVMTIEDPVEYSVRGIRQIQVNPRTNLTFETGLKSIVRQDPDVIMVGEIRDPQTASIAVNAALTGHLMLSSLHANDAAASFPRLYELNVESFLIASSMNLVIAQRLVRKICTHCMISYQLGGDELELVAGDEELRKLIQKIGGKKDLEKRRFYRGKGCSICGDTGYLGRMGIFELLEVDEAIRPLIVSKESSDIIRTFAHKRGMRLMIEDGIEKVFQGKTTIGEIIRATKT